MANITDFLPDVRIEVAGAMDGVITSAVRKTIREFCRKTTRWRVDLPDLTLVLGQTVYVPGDVATTIQLPTDGELALYAGAKQNGIPLTPTRKEDMDAIQFNWQVEQGSQMQRFYPSDPLTFNVWPIPTDVTFPVQIRAAFMPTVDAATCPDFIMDDWQETITAGAVSRLLNMADQEWTDLKTAALKRVEFLEGAADAQIQLDRGFATKVRTAKVPFFGG